MDFELLLKFIGYFPDYLSALSRTLLRSFGHLCRNSCILEQLWPNNLTFIPVIFSCRKTKYA